jgi:hypothetical protein
MKITWKSCVVSGAIASLALLSGCVVMMAGAASAGTVAWFEGRLDGALDAPFDKAEKAANLAITQLQFAKISEKKDALTDTLTARTAEDKKVEIKIIRVGEATARAQIRVGVFGDETLSLTVLDKIKANL